MTDLTDQRPYFLGALADASPLAMAVSEGANHILRYVNPAFCRVYGLSADELLGRSFEVCPNAERDAAKCLLDRVYASGAPEKLSDLVPSERGASSAFWSYAAWPLPGQNAVASQSEVRTDQHVADQQRQSELVAANQQLLIAALREDEISASLAVEAAAKDEFLAMLAHELRNPIAAIQNGVYLIRQRMAPEDSRSLQTVAMMERQLRHLARMLDDLLDVSRITRGTIELRLERVDLVTVVNHAIEGCSGLVEAGKHKVLTSVPSAPVNLDGDPVRLHQIVTNVFQNALKYSNPGGKIWVSLNLDANTASSLSPVSYTAVLTIRDEGMGISPNMIGSVFELFAQVDPASKRAQSGLGIGLNLVKNLVRLHGGTVEVESAGIGEGSEFRILLPLAHGK